MDNHYFKEINWARKKLGLEKEADLKEIKSSFRSLSLKYHPDKCSEKRKKECEEKFMEINRAYEIIMDYCAGYKYSFHKESIEENNPDKDYREHLEKFYDGWWFDLEKDKEKKVK